MVSVGTHQLLYDEPARTEAELLRRQGRYGFALWVPQATDDSRVVQIRAYKDGVLHGQYEEFHDTGKPSVRGKYRDGERHGKWTETDRAGERKTTADYAGGQLHGAVVVTQKGKTLTRQQWQRGLLVRLEIRRRTVDRQRAGRAVPARRRFQAIENRLRPRKTRHR